MKGLITVRMHMKAGHFYQYRTSSGMCYECRDEDLVIDMTKPPWVRKGVKFKWVGEGDEQVYKIVKVYSYKLTFEAVNVNHPDKDCKEIFGCRPQDLPFMKPLRSKKA